MATGFDRPVEPVAMDYHSVPGRLRIKWSDGHITDVRTERLRALCPCASCGVEREQRRANPLKLTLKPSGNAAALVKVDWVGNYGLMPIWGDGHETGIFTYHFLRHLENDE